MRCDCRLKGGSGGIALRRYAAERPVSSSTRFPCSVGVDSRGWMGMVSVASSSKPDVKPLIRESTQIGIV